MTIEKIACNPELCTGCQICELACSLAKEGEFSAEWARIHVARPDPTYNLAVACQLCKDAPCVLVCPRQALAQDPETGVIHLTEALCIGCGWCIEACDYGAITLDRRTKCVLICDLCEGQEVRACEASCPKAALALKSRDRPDIVSTEPETSTETRQPA